MEWEAQAEALWHVAPGVIERRAELVRAGPGEIGVRTLVSAVSRGTERLVHEGRVPASERERMRAPFQEGDFPFPVKYGYAVVGRVEHGPADLLGRLVFALHPHQSRLAAPPSALHPVPDALPPERAALAANMETALNAVWDAGAGPGDRCVVIGAGPVGLLTASLLARIAGCDVTVADRREDRAATAREIGARFRLFEPGALKNFDCAFHASASEAGLVAALDAVGPEGTVVEMSWHGEGRVALPLGGAFHARRLRLVSSQVGALPPARRPRWDHRRRMGVALDLLADPRLDALLTAEIPFAEAPARLPAVLSGPPEGLVTLIRY